MVVQYLRGSCFMICFIWNGFSEVYDTGNEVVGGMVLAVSLRKGWLF